MLALIAAAPALLAAPPAREPSAAPVPADWSLAAAQGSAPGAAPPEAAGEAAPPDREIVVEGEYGPPKQDPMIGVNEESYRISQAVDRAVVEPVAHAYRDNLPGPLRDGLGNVVRNLGEPSNALNFLLQGKVGKAFETLGRLAINSTLGLGGDVDQPAKPGIGLPYRRNGFANTLGYYGVGPGAYLYLPVTGATTVRDLFGSTLDQALLPLAVGRPFNRPAYAAGYFVINGLDQRLAFDEELAMIAASDDPYTLRRETYLARRAREIAALKGAPVADEEEEEAAEPGADAGPSAAPLPPHSRLRLPERVQLTAPAARAERR